MTDTRLRAPLVNEALVRNTNHTGSAADGVAPARVWIVNVRALAETEVTTWPLIMLAPKATADWARYCAANCGPPIGKGGQDR